MKWAVNVFLYCPSLRFKRKLPMITLLSVGHSTWFSIRPIGHTDTLGTRHTLNKGPLLNMLLATRLVVRALGLGQIAENTMDTLLFRHENCSLRGSLLRTEHIYERPCVRRRQLLGRYNEWPCCRYGNKALPKKSVSGTAATGLCENGQMEGPWTFTSSA